MIVLSKGWKLPETGDFGNVWFPALEDNINQMNSHDHDGVNSEKISGGNVKATSVTVTSGSFSLVSAGVYRATVTVPNAGLVDESKAVVKDPTSKNIMLLNQEKLNSTQFYIYINIPQNCEVYF